MFPAAARRTLAESGTDRDLAVLRTLHRICRVYAGVGIVVPVFGFATANSLGVLGDAWLITSIVLTVAAAGVLVLLVFPRQERILASIPHAGLDQRGPARLAMYTGMFNVLWAVVTTTDCALPSK